MAGHSLRPAPAARRYDIIVETCPVCGGDKKDREYGHHFKSGAVIVQIHHNTKCGYCKGKGAVSYRVVKKGQAG